MGRRPRGPALRLTLVDTSVWVEFLRGTPVLMELLAGARAGDRTDRLERLLPSQSWCPVEAGLDYRGAVDVYHATRATGHPPRSVNDCLIAAVPLRRGVPVAHRDPDYAFISAATGLAVVDLRP